MVLHVKGQKIENRNVNACIYWFSDILAVLLKYIGCFIKQCLKLFVFIIL